MSRKNFFNRIIDKFIDTKTDMQLSRKIEVKDIQGYLQDEFDRAAKREKRIDELEDELKAAGELKLKYDALLVVQEKVAERVERQDKRIKELKEQLQKGHDEKLKLKAKITEIRANAKKLAKKKKGQK